MPIVASSNVNADSRHHHTHHGKQIKYEIENKIWRVLCGQIMKFVVKYMWIISFTSILHDSWRLLGQVPAAFLARWVFIVVSQSGFLPRT